MINNITIVGIGYVGLSLSVLLSQKYKVNIHDKDHSKIDLINNKISPISDDLIQDFLTNKNLKITASSCLEKSIKQAELIILALPTNFDLANNSFDTSIIENVVSIINDSDNSAPILIKSTVPIGFTEKLNAKVKNRIIFSPEFLREGMALYDNLHPSRIIVGDNGELGVQIAQIFSSCTKNDHQVFLVSNNEAEAIKLFSNTYLANRVAFFNELDTFCLHHNLSTRAVIDGVSSDKRIGDNYNNPSFGYGGYCLPKDTMQLLSNFVDTPQEIIGATVKSNKTRKNFIANKIIELKPNTVGVYRLTMKTGSDNYRNSSILEIIEALNENKIPTLIYEPLIKENLFMNNHVIKDINQFKKQSDLIVANRIHEDLNDVYAKVFTRDLYKEN